ncbi:MAG: AAA family ATPase [Actinomycetota bacterium]|nr:MoxR family ATPase [Actinomycetota bacterium]
MNERLSSPGEVVTQLRKVGYLADEQIGTVVFLSAAIEKPILLEGPAGVGKTELAKSLATVLDMRLIRLQCYEGLDESKALYEWNYRKQLLRIQADKDRDWSQTEQDIFGEEYLLERPLLQAIRSSDPVLLLIDEVDRLDLEAEALLLEILSDWQVSIPESGTIVAVQKPQVVLTSNATRELSEALKRRCLFLPIAYPSIEREKEILIEKVPGLDDSLAARIAEVVRSIRNLDMKKSPSIAESIDWARTLVALGASSIGPEELEHTMGVLLKHSSDIDKARNALGTI